MMERSNTRKNVRIKCEECHTEFITNVKGRKCCSIICARILTGRKNRNGKMHKCENCGKEHYRSNRSSYRHVYCSRQCANEGLRVERIELVCDLDGCNNKFYRTQHQIDNYRKKNKNMFCSCVCASKNGLLKIQSKPRKVKRTRPEIEFSTLLKKLEIKFIYQYPLQWIHGWKKWYDFYLPEYNILIEIDGIYWHGKGIKYAELNEQQKQTRDNDKLKNKLAKDRGYKLLRIWSDMIHKFDKNKLK